MEKLLMVAKVLEGELPLVMLTIIEICGSLSVILPSII